MAFLSRSHQFTEIMGYNLIFFLLPLRYPVKPLIWLWNQTEVCQDLVEFSIRPNSGLDFDEILPSSCYR